MYTLNFRYLPENQEVRLNRELEVLVRVYGKIHTGESQYTEL